MVSELIHTFEATLEFVVQSVDDLSEQQMVEQPVGIPNHGSWTLGHLIFSCQGMVLELDKELWLPDDWESAFGYGSKPHSNRFSYPNKSNLVSLLADARTRVRLAIMELSESAWQRKTNDDSLPTLGHVLLQILVAHTAYHAGQLGVWRRVIGMPSAGVFV